MADLDTLRTEVRDAINRQDRQEKCDEYCPVCEDRATIRAELLRLANENANYGKRAVEQYKRGVYWMDRAKEAEAELAALKARIAEAPTAYLTSKTGIGPCNIASMAHGAVFDSSAYGKSVRIIMD